MCLTFVYFPCVVFLVVQSGHCHVHVILTANISVCLQEIRTYRGHADAISDVCFAGKDLLCSASLDNTLSIWHVEDGHR